MKNNYVIGITGGVGAGKSTVLYLLENDHHAHVFQADKAERTLTTSKCLVRDKVVALFGEDFLLPGGELDRPRVAQVIYSDPVMKEKLEAIIHPAVRRFLKAQTIMHKGIVVLEAALPVQAGFPQMCDEIWYVHTDTEVRIARLMKSRGYTREKCEAIIAGQMDEPSFRAISSRVIDNSGDFENTKRQIDEALASVVIPGGAADEDKTADGEVKL